MFPETEFKINRDANKRPIIPRKPWEKNFERWRNTWRTFMSMGYGALAFLFACHLLTAVTISSGRSLQELQQEDSALL